MDELLRIIFLTAGALPLLAYPFVAVASLMGLASKPGIKIPLFNRLMNKFFLWGTLLYPLVFFGCYKLSEADSGISGESSLIAEVFPAIFPLVFLCLLWVSFKFMDAPGQGRE